MVVYFHITGLFKPVSRVHLIMEENTHSREEEKTYELSEEECRHQVHFGKRMQPVLVVYHSHCFSQIQSAADAVGSLQFLILKR